MLGWGLATICDTEVHQTICNSYNNSNTSSLGSWADIKESQVDYGISIISYASWESDQLLVNRVQLQLYQTCFTHDQVHEHDDNRN